MNSRAAITALLLAVTAHAASLTTPEFEKLLRENYTLKQQGTADPDRFIASARGFADKGDASAQYFVGMILMRDDPKKSKEYLLKSSSAGCVGSMALLGMQYLREKDRNQAIPLMVKAAENGDATAQVFLAGAYLRGDGFEKSTLEAYVWLKLAERQSFSLGALAAIRDSVSKVENQLSAEEKAIEEERFAMAAKKFPVVDYVFCGQANPDPSRSTTVPNYLRM
jgi:TPR repeat protein